MLMTVLVLVWYGSESTCDSIDVGGAVEEMTVEKTSVVGSGIMVMRTSMAVKAEDIC